MGVFPIVFALGAALAPSSVAERCALKPAHAGLWSTPRIELCDPGGGCLPFDATVAVVNGCAEAARLPTGVTPVASQTHADAFNLQLRIERSCAPKVEVIWHFGRESAFGPRVEVKRTKTCGPKPLALRPIPLALTDDSFHPATAPLSLLSDAREAVRGAALLSALRRQTSPAVCEALDQTLRKRPIARPVAVQVAAAATEPCLIDALAQLLLEFGLPEADAALARIVDVPTERFRLAATATSRGMIAASLMHSLPQPFSQTEVQRLVAIAASRQAPARVVEAAFEHLAIAQGRTMAAELLLEEIDNLSPGGQAFLLEQPEARDHLASLPRQQFAMLPLHPSVSDADVFQLLSRRLSVKRTLSDEDWAQLVRSLPPSNDSQALALKEALACVAGRAPAQIPPTAADALWAAGYSLNCATAVSVDDDQAIDPTDFDRFDTPPPTPPTRRAQSRVATAPDPQETGEKPKGSGAQLAEGTNQDRKTANATADDDKANNDAGTEEATDASNRATYFNGGFSIAPFLDATAFFQGPMAGGGLMGAWHIDERFSLVAMGSATFTCTICLDGTTGSRTDLRVDAGASANLFTESDVTPYARLTLAAMHIEIVDIRRASFHDAIGPELTIGIDWLPVPGARVFIETGAFWAFELTRSVRPAGQVAPSPRGIPPVDGSTFGVAARLGVTLGL